MLSCNVNQIIEANTVAKVTSIVEIVSVDVTKMSLKIVIVGCASTQRCDIT